MSGSLNSKSLQQILACIQTGRLDKARALCSKALRKHPKNATFLNAMAIVALEGKQYQLTIEYGKRAVAIEPGNPGCQYTLGLGYNCTRQYENALLHLQEAVRLQPDFGAAYTVICSVLNDTSKTDEAIRAGQTALAINPNDAFAHTNLANAFLVKGDADAAWSHYERAAALAPDNPEFLKNIGSMHLGTGNREAGEKYLRKSIRVKPDYAESYLLLALAGPVKNTADIQNDIDRMEQRVSDPAVTGNERATFHFALGLYYERLKKHDKAFANIATGNGLKNQEQTFRPEVFSKYVDRVIAAFNSDTLDRLRDCGNNSEMPVFIVGMPRSGTTLVEQILSCHPDVFGAGELQWFHHLETGLAKELRASGEYPECIDLLGSQSIKGIAKNYLQYIDGITGESKRVINKSPDNALRLGLIKLIFPRARFILCRRDPMDTCVSMYFQIFKGDIGYSYDLFNLGAYFAEHERLLEYWRDALDIQLLEIDYESLVRDQEDKSRELIQFMGLDWNDACLDFHDSKRFAQTASMMQVQEPIYSRSVGKWRNYEPYLEPLKRGLDYRKNTKSPGK